MQTTCRPSPESILDESGYTLKEYTVFRVDEQDGWSRELAGESDLEQEAVRFAGMLLFTEAEEDVYYEVRLSRTGELVDLVDPGEGPCPFEEGELSSEAPLEPEFPFVAAA